MNNFRQSQLNFSSGGRDSLNGTSNDGWFTTGKSAKSVLIDQNKLWNMAKVISVPVVRRTDIEAGLQITVGHRTMSD